MGNQDKELREAVQQLADGEGVRFNEAMKLAITTLRYECQRRKEWREAGPASCNANCGHMNSGSRVEI